jgi:hypothetical protein
VNRADALVSLQPADADERAGTALTGKPFRPRVDGELSLGHLLARVGVMLVTTATGPALAMPVAPAAGHAPAIGAEWR